MTIDEIHQKLTALPDGVAESNLQSWENVVLHYKGRVEHPIGDILSDSFRDKAILAIYSWVRDFSKTEQAKLFRGGTSVGDVWISTADNHGLRIGDLFVSVTFRGSQIILQYEVASPITIDENPNVIKRMSCGLDDNLMLLIQPLLDYLWNDTRGKKNA